MSDKEEKRGIERVSRPFLDVSRHLFHYSRGKMRWDPAYPEVAARLMGTALPVLDLGCGPGVLAAYLRERGITVPLRGIDTSREKIEAARRCVAARHDQMAFEVGDALEVSGFSGNIVALDVLHYFTDTEQRRFFQTLAAMLAPGGVLLLRTTLRDNSWRFRVTRLEEWFIRATGWIAGGSNNFATRGSIEAALNEESLDFEVLPMWGRTPFNSYLFVIFRR